MKCPVCGKELTIVYCDRLDGWILLEESIKCEDGHYEYEYSYGYWTEIINGVVKEGSYLDKY